MSLNGILAGLVGITAGADVMLPHTAVLVGLIAGGLVVGSVILLDRVKVDDPVGAISVHLTCGIWGTLAVGLFSTNPEHSFGIQLVGVLAYGAFTVAGAALLFGVLKVTMGIRVSEEEEIEGLDLAEHGMHSYDLQTSGGALANVPGLAGGAAVATATELATESR